MFASLFDSAVRAAAVLGLALLAMPALRWSSASARRLVLSVAFASVLVVPFLPSWRAATPVVRALVGRVVTEPAIAVADLGARAQAAVPRASGIDVVALAWALGALIVAARLATGLFVARRLLARAADAPPSWQRAIDEAERRTGVRGRVRVSGDVEVPVVACIGSPVVLVPESSVSWTDERRLSVLVHELAHVVAGDLFVQLLAAIVCSLHWFNPLAWLSARRLRLERELAADEAVLRAGVRPSAYAEDLLALAASPPAGTAAFGEKPLAARIRAIVAERRPRPLGPKGASVLACGTAALVLGAACSATSESVTAQAPQVHALDGELQAAADRELAGAIAEWNAKGGTILVMSPNGTVLAEAGGHADRPYVTGSTLKPILLAAALDEGVVAESDVFDCSPGERGGKTLRDSSPAGHATLPELVARSSNVGFAQVFDRLGGRRFDRALRRFHFATPPSLVDAPAGDYDGALVAIGATMTATPRQVARAYAALADGGGGIVKPSTAARVTALLEGVVTSEHGTGKKARVAGARVAGKTGTSDWSAEDGSRATYASFVGYVPAERPRYVVFVGIESPSGEVPWGGDVAAPIFARVAARALAR